MLGLGNTLSGGIVPAAAVAGFSNTKSINFDGTNDFAVGGNVTFDQGSYSLWLKAAEGDLGTALMVRDGFYFYLTGNAGGAATAYVSTPIGNMTWIGATGQSAAVLNDDEWHHIVVTFSGGSGVASESKFYLDGDYNNGFTSGGHLTWSEVAKPIKIGYYVNDAGSFTGAYFKGNLDEISWWDDTVLDAEAITVLYNNGEPIDLSEDSGDYDNSGDLTHWWRMGDGDTFDTITDNTGSNDLTMTNMVSGDIEDDVPS